MTTKNPTCPWCNETNPRHHPDDSAGRISLSLSRYKALPTSVQAALRCLHHSEFLEVMIDCSELELKDPEDPTFPTLMVPINELLLTQHDKTSKQEFLDSRLIPLENIVKRMRTISDQMSDDSDWAELENATTTLLLEEFALDKSDDPTVFDKTVTDLLDIQKLVSGISDYYTQLSVPMEG